MCVFERWVGVCIRTFLGFSGLDVVEVRIGRSHICRVEFLLGVQLLQSLNLGSQSRVLLLQLLHTLILTIHSLLLQTLSILLLNSLNLLLLSFFSIFGQKSRFRRRFYVFLEILSLL